MRKRYPTTEYVYIQLYGMSEEVRMASISICSDNISKQQEANRKQSEESTESMDISLVRIRAYALTDLNQ